MMGDITVGLIVAMFILWVLTLSFSFFTFVSNDYDHSQSIYILYLLHMYVESDPNAPILELFFMSTTALLTVVGDTEVIIIHVILS